MLLFLRVIYTKVNRNQVKTVHDLKTMIKFHEISLRPLVGYIRREIIFLIFFLNTEKKKKK